MSSLTKGLVGHWDFAPENVDNGVVWDRTAYGNDLTSLDTPQSLLDSPAGSAVVLDGNQSGFEAPNTASLNQPGTFSWSVWVKFASLPTDNLKTVMSKGYDGNESVALQLDHRISAIRFYSYDGNTAHQVTSDFSRYDTDTWHHLTVLYDGTTYQIYKNASDATDSVSNPGTGMVQTGTRFTVGCRDNNGGFHRHAEASFADVRAYNRALSAKEVRRLYNTRDHGEGQQGSGISGIVAHWPLSDSGSVAKDVVGDCDLTLRNGVVTGVTAPTGQGMQFDGADDFVGGEPVPVALADENYSFTGWVNTSTAAAQEIVGVNQSDGGNRLLLGVRKNGSGDWVINARNNASGSQAIGSTPIDDGEWHFVAVSARGDTIYVYLDGRLEAQIGRSGLTIDSSDLISIGQEYDGGTSSSDTSAHFDGEISDVRAYNRGLDTEEIRFIYDQGLPVPESGLVGWWTLDDADTDESTAYDRVGSNHGDASNVTVGSDGVVGEACSFDTAGITGFSSKIIPSQTDRTFSAWIRTTDGSQRQGVFGTRTISNDGVVLTINRNGNGNLSVFHTGFGSDGVLEAPDVLEANVWQHVVMAYDASETKASLFANGAQVAEGTLPLEDISSWNGVIGAEQKPNDTNPFQGRIDDVRIYDRALSEKEIRALYETRDPYYRNQSGSVTKRPTIITGATQSLWTPRMLGEKLSVFCDASLSDMTTSSGDIDSWGDQSGSAEEVISEGSPELHQNVLGGKPAVWFESAAFTGQAPVEAVFTVTKDIVNNGPDAYLFDFRPGASSYVNSNFNRGDRWALNGGSLQSTDRPRPFGTGRSDLLYAESNDGASQNWHLGGYNDSPTRNAFQGYIATFIGLAEKLTQEEADLLAGWAAHRYGLTGKLPAGHPYKSAPPQV